MIFTDAVKIALGWQAEALRLRERMRAVRKVLAENGCECPCDHHPDERGDDCEVCLPCRIGEAVGGWYDF